MSTIGEVVNTEQPTIVEIVLYRNNWKDNQLIHAFKKNSDLLNVSADRDSFFVDIGDFKRTINMFGNEIQKFDSMSGEYLVRSVNSLYFIQNIIQSFESLKFVKVTVSNKRKYSRLVKEIISFSVKILHSTIKLDNYLEKHEKAEVKAFFKSLGIIHSSPVFEQTYVSMRVSELFQKIEAKRGYVVSEDENDVTNKILYFIDQKTEVDNPTVLFIF